MAESAKSVCIVTQEFVEHEFSVVNINSLGKFHFEHIHDEALKTQFVHGNHHSKHKHHMLWFRGKRFPSLQRAPWELPALTVVQFYVKILCQNICTFVGRQLNVAYSVFPLRIFGHWSIRASDRKINWPR